MKKIKVLLQLIKTNTIAQVVTGVLVIGIVGGGGVLTHNAYKNKLIEEEAYKAHLIEIEKFEKEREVKLAKINDLLMEVRSINPEYPELPINDDNLDETIKEYESSIIELKELAKKEAEEIKKKEELKNSEEVAIITPESTSNSEQTNKPSSSSNTSNSNQGQAIGQASKPVEQTPAPAPIVQESAKAPDGYKGGVAINWELTNKINDGSKTYNQSINRENFQSYLNGVSLQQLRSESKPYEVSEVMINTAPDGSKYKSQYIAEAYSFYADSVAVNSNNIESLKSAADGLAINLGASDRHDSSRDYVENFVVYNGTTNVVYKFCVGSILLHSSVND